MTGAVAAARAWRLAAVLGAAGCLSLAGCGIVPEVGTPGGPVSAVPVDQAKAEAIISAYRKTHGLGDVSLDPVLQRVAQRQAEAMARADELSHSVAGTLPLRLASEGADRRAAIENVSGGYGSLDSALGGWRRSPAHNANLLFGPVRRMGIAAASAPKTRFKTFWSLVMTN